MNKYHELTKSTIETLTSIAQQGDISTGHLKVTQALSDIVESLTALYNRAEESEINFLKIVSVIETSLKPLQITSEEQERHKVDLPVKNLAFSNSILIGYRPFIALGAVIGATLGGSFTNKTTSQGATKRADIKDLKSDDSYQDDEKSNYQLAEELSRGIALNTLDIYFQYAELDKHELNEFRKFFHIKKESLFDKRIPESAKNAFDQIPEAIVTLLNEASIVTQRIENHLASNVTPRKHHIEETVIFYTSDDVDQTEYIKIREALDEWLRGFNTESVEYLPPKFGSLLQIIKVVFSGDYKKRALANLQTAFAAEAEASLESVQTEKTDNIVKLSAALKDHSNASLLAGKVLALKVTIDGESYTIVQEITDEFKEQLRANPLLMRDPQAIYRMLKKDQDDLNNQQNLMTG